MTEILFQLTFLLIAPFWALMILAPKWRWTEKIVSSYLITLPPVLIYVVLALPDLAELLPLVARPEIPALAQYMATPEGVALVWAHMIAWDLFVGRWMYLESRRLNVNPLVMAPILVITILLAPFGLPLFLIVRKVCDAKNSGAAVVTHQ